MKNNGAFFGVAGNSLSFYDAGFSHLLEVPQYLKDMKLQAYEYQCGHGTKLAEEKAKAFAKLALEHNIFVSVHAPYYISLSSLEADKREKSVGYILQTAALAKHMGASRVVIHSGSAGKLSRGAALSLAKETLKKANSALKSHGLLGINLCPETMGKVNQLGTLEEVLELCLLSENFIPCVDFGHINAREQGLLSNKREFEKLLEQIENKLGVARMRNIHVHFSKIEYTKGGEKRHLTFEDQIFGPKYEDFIDIILKKDCRPVVICESRGTQAEDAKIMQNYYLNKLKFMINIRKSSLGRT